VEEWPTPVRLNLVRFSRHGAARQATPRKDFFFPAATSIPKKDASAFPGAEVFIRVRSIRISHERRRCIRIVFR
jgi:hypothetical protein